MATDPTSLPPAGAYSNADFCIVCMKSFTSALPNVSSSDHYFFGYHETCKGAIKGPRPDVYVFEGLDRVGKTTQLERMEAHFKSLEKRVLRSQEVGSKHPKVVYAAPWRGWMLHKKYEENRALLCEEITQVFEEHKDRIDPKARSLLNWILRQEVPPDNHMTNMDREHISQAIRAVHNRQLLYPSLYSGEYDVILLDRGTYSGFAYATAYEVGEEEISYLVCQSTGVSAVEELYQFYDLLFFMVGNVEVDFDKRGDHKAEFKEGDVVEGGGVPFQLKVQQGFKKYQQLYDEPMYQIDVSGKSIDEVEAFLWNEHVSCLWDFSTEKQSD